MKIYGMKQEETVINIRNKKRRSEKKRTKREVVGRNGRIKTGRNKK